MQAMMKLILVAAAIVLVVAAGCQQAGSGGSDTFADEGPGKDVEGCERVPLPVLEPPDLTGGPSEVLLDENGTFVVNGEKFFPYGFYRVPETAEQMEDYVDAGFNTALFGGGCCESKSLDGQIEDLEWLAGYGVMGVGRAFSPVDQIYDVDDETLAGWLDARHASGNTLFWYTYDEPGLHSVDKQEAADYHQKLHDLDPGHPNALVDATLEDYTEYIDYTDFMMVDPYPVPAYPLAYVREAYDEASEASGGAKRVMGVPQAFDWYVYTGAAPEDHTWRPTGAELRNMHYQYAVLGANGMIAWNYDAIYAEPERWEEMKAVAAEIVELMPLLVEPDADVAIARDPDPYNLLDAVKELEGIYYLLIVSVWINDIHVTYDLSVIGDDLCVIDYWTELPVEVTDGMVSLTIAAEDVTVLQIIPQ